MVDTKGRRRENGDVMKRLTTITASALVVAFVSATSLEAQSVRVRGHFRKDGTYVQPHYRTAPDGRFYNNWSTKGNFNPYTGESGTQVNPPLGSTGFRSYGSSYVPKSYSIPSETYIAPTLPTFVPSQSNVDTWQNQQRKRDQERATYWKDRGYSFDASFMSAYAMDQKVKDIERAKSWKEKGYDFNPEFMSAYAMDQKVKDIDRAKALKEKGYNFNPDFMSAYAMDQKVKDIERAKFWKEKGYSFNPDFMSAYAMDQKVKDIERAKYWKERGCSFNADFMSAYAMDQEAQKALKSR